jgi:hypothetical protein
VRDQNGRDAFNCRHVVLVCQATVPDLRVRGARDQKSRRRWRQLAAFFVSVR